MVLSLGLILIFAGSAATAYFYYHAWLRQSTKRKVDSKVGRLI
jgi:hypothetical protein